MRRALAIPIAAALLFAGCGSAIKSEPGSLVRVTCDPPLERVLRAWGKAGFSGSMAVSTRGRTECTAAYGTADRASGQPNSPGTVFDIGSITKAFTAAAVLDLVDAGELSLSDRAGELLPTLRGPVRRASVRELLLHTSGLVGSHGSDHKPLGRTEALNRIGSLEQAFPPGTDFSYSNAGYTLLAIIVEQASGTSFRGYLASHLLRLPDGSLVGGFWDGDPAARGPRAVGYLEDGSAGQRGDFRGPHWAVEGNGGLAMTMERLGAWTHALFSGQLLSPRATRIVGTPGFRLPGGQSESPGWVIYDASVFGQTVITSAGGGGDVGQDAVVVWLPKTGRTIAIASNTPTITAEQLLQAIGPALAEGKLPPPPKQLGRGGDHLSARAGTYELVGGGSFQVGLHEGQLAISARGAQPVRALFPTHPGYSAAQVGAHERAVLDLLAGGSEDGRREREALESTLGPLDGVELEGSIVRDGELRTYVVARSGERRLLLWYALNDQGAVGAAEANTEPPTLLFADVGGGRYQPDDPTGAITAPIVTFERGRMKVRWPGGTVSAKRRGP